MGKNMDLKIRERWTQPYNNTSQVLNQILKDRQMRDWEKRMREIEEYEKDRKKVEEQQARPGKLKTTDSDQ